MSAVGPRPEAEKNAAIGGDKGGYSCYVLGTKTCVAPLAIVTASHERHPWKWQPEFSIRH